MSQSGSRRGSWMEWSSAFGPEGKLQRREEPLPDPDVETERKEVPVEFKHPTTVETIETEASFGGQVRKRTKVDGSHPRLVKRDAPKRDYDSEQRDLVLEITDLYKRLQKTTNHPALRPVRLSSIDRWYISGDTARSQREIDQPFDLLAKQRNILEKSFETLLTDIQALPGQWAVGNAISSEEIAEVIRKIRNRKEQLLEKVARFENDAAPRVFDYEESQKKSNNQEEREKLEIQEKESLYFLGKVFTLEKRSSHINWEAESLSERVFTERGIALRDDPFAQMVRDVYGLAEKLKGQVDGMVKVVRAVCRNLGENTQRAEESLRAFESNDFEGDIKKRIEGYKTALGAAKAHPGEYGYAFAQKQKDIENIQWWIDSLNHQLSKTRASEEEVSEWIILIEQLTRVVETLEKNKIDFNTHFSYRGNFSKERSTVSVDYDWLRIVHEHWDANHRDTLKKYIQYLKYIGRAPDQRNSLQTVIAQLEQLLPVVPQLERLGPLVAQIELVVEQLKPKVEEELVKYAEEQKSRVGQRSRDLFEGMTPKEWKAEQERRKERYTVLRTAQEPKNESQSEDELEPGQPAFGAGDREGMRKAVMSDNFKHGKKILASRHGGSERKQRSEPLRHFNKKKQPVSKKMRRTVDDVIVEESPK